MACRIVHLCLIVVLVTRMWKSVRGEGPDLSAFCTNYLTSPPKACDTGQCQGRAGKRGPIGMKGDTGAKGEKGDVGPGTEDLKRRLVALEEKLSKSEKMAAFNFCALGMKSGKISDNSITTSQYWDAFSRGQFARLDYQATSGTSSGSWCAGAADKSKWLKVDLGKMQPISGLVMQGSPSSNHWMTSFTVSCGDSLGTFKDIVEHGAVKVFTGNTNRNGKAVNMFADVVTCRYVRVNAKGWYGRPCLRLELLRGSCHSPNRFEFYVESAGYEDGDNCKVQINGVERAKRGRGHCVVTFDVKTKDITAQTFDTHASTPQVSKLLNFLKSTSNYSVIAIAVMDSGNPARWNSEISSLMEDLGAVGKTKNSSSVSIRDSWAFITQKVSPNDPRPSWVKYQHVLHLHGKATVHAAITLSAFYPSWEDTPIY